MDTNRHEKPPHADDGTPSLKALLKPIVILLVGVGMIFAAWKITQPGSPPPPPPPPPPTPAPSAAPATPPDYGPRKKAFLEKEIAPLIAAEDAHNREAIKRAEARVNEVFATYRTNVPAFADALTEWGTKYKITKAMVQDWRAKTNEAGKVPTALFAEKVVSDKKITADIAGIVEGLQNDFSANRDLMLSEATLRLKTADFPVPALSAPGSKLLTVFNQELNLLLEKRGQQLPMVKLLGFGGGWVAEEAVKMLVQQVVRMVTVRMGTIAVEAGGATATGALGGGAAGTAAEPGGGTLIGVGLGLLAGILVDTWMESRFKEKITAESDVILEKMRAELWSNKAEGLEFRFNQLADTTRECHGETLRKIIIGK